MPIPTSRINIARARLGLGEEAIANAKICFSGTDIGKYSKEQPNGLFYWNWRTAIT